MTVRGFYTMNLVRGLSKEQAVRKQVASFGDRVFSQYGDRLAEMVQKEFEVSPEEIGGFVEDAYKAFMTIKEDGEGEEELAPDSSFVLGRYGWMKRTWNKVTGKGYMNKSMDLRYDNLALEVNEIIEHRRRVTYDKTGRDGWIDGAVESFMLDVNPVYKNDLKEIYHFHQKNVLDGDETISRKDLGVVETNFQYISLVLSKIYTRGCCRTTGGLEAENGFKAEKPKYTKSME